MAVLVFTADFPVWIFILSTIYVDNNSIICHHMKDDYIIPVDTIDDVELIENTADHRFSR